MSHTVLSLVLNAGYVVKGVLLILSMFSVVSWGIMFFKWRFFSKASAESEDFVRYFRSGKNPAGLNKVAGSLLVSPLASLYKMVFAEGNFSDPDEIRRSLRRYATLESAKLERYLNFLATTGSTTPFIGLFGTVWGIMGAFQGIGAMGSASLSVVAPGIAEALIATAAGLVAAIPAVIGYNYFLSAARRLSIEIEDFSEDLLAFFSRHVE
jgi:biopolymer transport protein TolQ